MWEEEESAQVSDETLVLVYQSDPDGAKGRRAAGQLIARWQGRVYAWARRYVRERDTALDLAQDCLLQMYQALPRYESRGRFSAWLFTIVHHRCLSAVRRHTLVRDPEVDTDELPGAPPPEDQLESAEWQRRVMAAIRDALEPHERTALWLRAYEGMSVEDITHLMGLDGASGARGVLQTARRKLRAALGVVRSPGGDES
jgi:RNA polymerase sigma-70 factor (ECF subfamily)